MEVFKTKFKAITKFDFHSVKRERSSVIVPAVKPGHKWDFAHIKNLCGQGRPYVQLNVHSCQLLEREGEEDDDIDLNPSSPIDLEQSIFEIPTVRETEVQSLQQIFPSLSANDASDAIFRFGSISASGSGKQTEKPKGNNEKPTSSSETLHHLQTQLQGPAEKLTVDKEDLLSDAFYYYKHKDFDARHHFGSESKIKQQLILVEF